LPRNFLRLNSIGVVLCCLGWLVPNSAAQAVRIEGVVRDGTGASVAKAAVTLKSGSFSASTTSDDGGRFIFIGVPYENGSVAVQAQGFVLVSRPWNAAPGAVAQIEITLQPSGANERIVVSAARAELRLAETPGSAVSLSDLDVASTPALMADDVLRQVPGFSLFRRSDSRTANPTAQGVSLRGLGASGTSRALVLEDGIPLLDPFGGWVYWDRVPVAALSSVEVFRGGASNLYGSDAMGGVVQFITRQAHEGPAITIETSYGNEQTPDLSVWSGTTVGRRSESGTCRDPPICFIAMATSWFRKSLVAAWTFPPIPSTPLWISAWLTGSAAMEESLSAGTITTRRVKMAPRCRPMTPAWPRGRWESISN